MPSKRESFDALVEANRFIEGKPFIFLNETLCSYKKGWYQKVEDRRLWNAIAKQLTHLDSPVRLSEVKETAEMVKTIVAEYTRQQTINPRLMVNVRNGIINLETFELHPHDPNMIFTYEVNANFNPHAKCPKWLAFLREVLVDENFEPDPQLIAVVQEIIGYCFYPYLPFHVAFILFGKGRNGKSVLVMVLEALLPDLVAFVDLEELGAHRFVVAELADKFVNVSAETSSDARLKEAKIKSVIAGDEQHAERKYEHPFRFRPFSKHIIMTNNLPTTKDQTDAFFDRFIVIPFRRKFISQSSYDELDPSEKHRYGIKIPSFEKVLFEELDGIFMWALDGLKSLLARVHGSAQTATDLIDRLGAVDNAAVRYSVSQAIDSLLPKGSKEAAQKINLVITANEKTADRNKIAGDAPLKQVMYRIETRAN